jgi:hypothetical protein
MHGIFALPWARPLEKPDFLDGEAQDSVRARSFRERMGQGCTALCIPDGRGEVVLKRNLTPFPFSN